MRAAALLALCAAAIAFPIPSAAAAVANGKIAFTAWPATCPYSCGKYARVFSMNPDGSDLTQLGSTTPMTQAATFYDENGSYSPDGKQIVFTRGTLDDTDSLVLTEVWVMRADGSNPHRVIEGMEPHWTPDGRIGVRGRDGTLSIVTTSGVATTLIPGFAGYNLAWALQGGLIVYAQGSGLWVMRDDGTNRKQIGDGWEPDWSPDATRIIDVCSDGSDLNLCTWQADGSDRVQVTHSKYPERNSAPHYSPDGRKFVFARTLTVDDGWGPFTMNLDGSDARPLPVPLGWRTQSYSWQPTTPTPTPSATPSATPIPDPQSTPEPGTPPVATANPAPTPKPSPGQRTVVPSRFISVPFEGAYRIGKLSRAKACKGRVTLELRRGKVVLGRATTRLDRRCRYSATFSIGRARVGKAKVLVVVARFHGNRYLGATKNRFTIQAPRG